MGFIYEHVASCLEDAIVKGVYPEGARLPSIRELRSQFRVSASTAMEAYAVLEEKGLIQPKPKSGHFVKQRRQLADQPAKTWPSADPESITVAHHTMELCWAPTKTNSHSLTVTAPLPTASQELARCIARAARLNIANSTKYERPEGARTLREAIARLMAERSTMIAPDDVIVTNGAHEALVLALRATTDPGDVVAVESPTYFGVLQAMEGHGLQALSLPTHPRKGVDLGALEQAARNGAMRACVLGPTHQNPLGFTMSDNAKRKAVEILARYEVPLIEDDVYGFVSIDAPGAAPAKSFDLTGNVIFCGSFSKTLSPAIRLGWGLPGRFASQFLRQKWLANLSTNIVPQLAVVEFLKGNRFRRLMQHSAREYARRIMLMRDWVLRCFPAGTKCTAPDGGMVLWVELPDGFDAMSALAEAREAGVSFLPGNIFAASADYRNFLRLSTSATDLDAIPEVIQRLGRAIHKCHGEPDSLARFH